MHYRPRLLIIVSRP